MPIASSPHAAGTAALIKGANPIYSPAQIENMLQSRAVDMGDPGMDIKFGYGRVCLGDPPSAATPIPISTLANTATPTNTSTPTNTATPSPTSTATHEPPTRSQIIGSFYPLY